MLFASTIRHFSWSEYLSADHCGWKCIDDVTCEALSDLCILDAFRMAQHLTYCAVVTFSVIVDSFAHIRDCCCCYLGLVSHFFPELFYLCMYLDFVKSLVI
jgi:hypothetical protein